MIWTDNTSSIWLINETKIYIYCIIAHSGKFSVAGHLSNSCPPTLGSILSLALVVSLFLYTLSGFLKFFSLSYFPTQVFWQSILSLLSK